MRPFPRGFRLAFVVAGLALLTALVVPWNGLCAQLEGLLRERLGAAAAHRGLRADFKTMTVSPPLGLRLGGVVVEGPDVFRADFASATADLGFAEGLRLHLGAGVIVLPGDLRVELRPSTWRVKPLRRSSFRAVSRDAGGRLAISYATETVGERLRVAAQRVSFSRLATLTWRDHPVLQAGALTGTVNLALAETGEVSLDGGLRGKGVRFAALPEAESRPAASPSPGPPTVLDASFSMSLSSAARSIRVSALRVATDGFALSSYGQIDYGRGDLCANLHVEAERVDFARSLTILGVSPLTPDLGTVALAVAAKGCLGEPESLRVSQEVHFVPPSRLPAAIARLRGSFVQQVRSSDGAELAIDISEASPSFVPLGRVPPLLIVALQLAEDAAYWDHQGVDVSAMIEAVSESWVDSGPLRGGSTIPQQLAKNLFLTRERSLSRKLHEFPLALLLDASLGKQRMLEIYLNIVEWGPGVYGLGAAASHYFGKSPAELSPKEVAFLVRLIPGPVSYQRSFDCGAVSPAFEGLVARLLAKLLSVKALTEEEYRIAMSEQLAIRGVQDSRCRPMPPMAG
jgi:hypothetical protein